MEIYKNDYARDEDEALWELHEIRHRLHQELKAKPIEEINKRAAEKFCSWNRER